MEKLPAKLLGVFVVLIAGLIIYQEISKRLKCKEHAKGIVVDFREKVEKEKGREKIKKYPIFEYIANGTTVRGNFNEKSKIHPYELSDTVDIYYNKNKVDEFYIKGNADSIIVGIIVLAMGLLLILA